VEQVLGGGYKSTCETDPTCSLYVVLALYKTKTSQGTMATKCDYIRFWSPASSSAEFHHHAMRIVVRYLRENNKVPNLQRVRLWTDGHAGTYKGFPNFGRMAHWPLHKPEPEEDAGVASVSLKFNLTKPTGLSFDDRLIVTKCEGQASALLLGAMTCREHSGGGLDGVVSGSGKGHGGGEGACCSGSSDSGVGGGGDTLPALSTMKVGDLRKELESRGLDINGRKSELAARLKKALRLDCRCVQQWRIKSVGGVIVHSEASFFQAVQGCQGSAVILFVEVSSSLIVDHDMISSCSPLV
jgi:hypothetical protein